MDDFNKALLANDPKNLSGFISSHILNDIPAVFNDDQKVYDDFRSRIATKFGVKLEDVIVVGSARLGFSYKKKTPFNSESDVDVAIVNDDLFDQYSRILCSYHHDVIRYAVFLQGNEWNKYLGFLKYFAAGWLRPDKGTTIMNKNPRATDWWDYFKTLSYGKSEVGNHKVNAGIYKSDFYLHEYMKIGLKDCRNSLIKRGAYSE